MRRRIRDCAARAEGGSMNLRSRACSFLLLFCILLAAHSAIGKKIPPAAPLDLNTATAAQLAQVPGIGAATAKAIVQFREKSGRFERIEDLLAIRGISARKLVQIRPYVTLPKPAPRKSAAYRAPAVFCLCNSARNVRSRSSTYRL
jgi:competence ComEA-like helix-hairpin-helix protein